MPSNDILASLLQNASKSNKDTQGAAPFRTGDIFFHQRKPLQTLHSSALVGQVKLMGIFKYKELQF